MDISAILPAVSMGNETSSLNDDFSAQTAAGDNIFTKPMGERTFFRTPSGGLVCASFVFDPKQEYGEDHNMASVTSDWMADMRDALTLVLLKEEEIAPKTKTLEETLWDQVTSLVPKETLAKNLFADKEKFKEYLEILKLSVKRNYIEENRLTECMKTDIFSFSFEIAIDAYPTELTQNKERKKNNRLGVLTFHIEGIPSGIIPERKVLPENEKKSKKRKAINGTVASSPSDSKTNVKDKKASPEKKQTEKEKLLITLGMDECFAAATVEKIKKFPHTATGFFDCINRWFSGTVSRRATKLEKARNRNPLYH